MGKKVRRTLSLFSLFFPNMPLPTLILASGSRDRKNLFELANIPFEIIVSDFIEENVLITDPLQLVQQIARGKAENVYQIWNRSRSRKEGSAIIIAADTMVTINGQLIGKATSADHAFEILSMLTGQTHEILTGVALLRTDLPATEYKSFVSVSKVHFQSLTPEEIWQYIRITDEFKGRAGAYSLEERASLFIDYIEGSPTNVIGLPMAELRFHLKQWGINLLNLNRQKH
jgi:septum formation protein